MKNVLYKRQEKSSLLTDNSSVAAKVYKIRDLPPEEKPREKLFEHGPQALTSAELLAVVLNVGSKKESILELTSRILKEYGESGIFHEHDPKKLAQELQISQMKALQLVACAELGRRFFEKRTHGATVLRTPADVFAYARHMADLSKENLRGLYLDPHHRLIHDEVISIGTVDANIAHPREVFRPAFEHNAVAVILVHNHPSGIATPSSADKEFTKQVHESGKILGIELLDHLVITRDSFTSITLYI